MRAYFPFPQEEALQPPLPIEVQHARLGDHFKDYHVRHDFKPGDYVRIKPGLEVFKFPMATDLCIVLGTINPPIPGDSPCEKGTTLTVRVLHIYDGRPYIAAYDGALFEPYPADLLPRPNQGNCVDAGEGKV